MNELEYEKMTNLIEKSKQILDDRFLSYFFVYKNKKIFREYKEGFPTFVNAHEIIDMDYYREANMNSNICIDFECYGIEISFERLFSGCSSESCSFSLPKEILLGTDKEYSLYLDNLKEKISLENKEVEAKYLKRLAEIESFEKNLNVQDELKEYERLKAKYG